MKYFELGFWTRGQGDKGTRGIRYQQSFSLSPPPGVPPSLRRQGVPHSTENCYRYNLILNNIQGILNVNYLYRKTKIILSA